MDRFNRHSFVLHRADEVGDAVVLVILIGTRQQQHVFGKLTETGPNLTAVNDPVVTIANSASLQINQIRACTWLTETLAPDIFTGKNSRQIGFLLRFRAVD